MLKDMIARISQTLDFIVIPPQTLFVVGYTVIHPANLVCGGVYCFHVVHPSVRASIRDTSVFSSPEPKAHKVSLPDGTRAVVRVSVRPHFQT